MGVEREKKEPRVKYFCAVLYSGGQELAPTKKALEARFGPVDFISKNYEFRGTDYYEQEMGQGLVRQIWGFENLASPLELAQGKLDCIKIETELSESDKRKVNLDIGYLDLFKVILASSKERVNKTYLGSGIWADWVAHYESGSWEAFSWAFPDFAGGQYNPDFEKLRLAFKLARRAAL
ncbi:MAG: DUF4416 family protein [SAR324 cluster bacterium]|nr:DUF4416 family protein [SAR324 cluster bacterium]